MSRELFTDYNPRAATLDVVEQANIIIAEYQAQGFTLTVRQLYYQFVARDLLPENTQQQYKRIGSIVRDARNGGLIDWDAIVDRTRERNTHNAWDNPADIIRGAAKQYREDPWANQEYRPEVWVEKEAMLGVLENICTDLRVPYYAHRGNDSQTSQYEAGKRFAGQIDQGLTPIVFHLADHDPNGIDMTRDITKRLALYAREDIEVKRIALNSTGFGGVNQIQLYNPPPNFVKEGDTRTSGYRDRFGTDECWELDALSPTVIADLIRREVEALIDDDLWDTALAKEEKGRKLLAAASANWAKVEKLLA
jgi:hypothetical protein